MVTYLTHGEGIGGGEGGELDAEGRGGGGALEQNMKGSGGSKSCFVFTSRLVVAFHCNSASWHSRSWLPNHHYDS